jgi:hypothetical protein
MQFTTIPPNIINNLAFPLKRWWGDASTGAVYAIFRYVAIIGNSNFKYYHQPTHMFQHIS